MEVLEMGAADGGRCCPSLVVQIHDGRAILHCSQTVHISKVTFSAALITARTSFSTQEALVSQHEVSFALLET